MFLVASRRRAFFPADALRYVLKEARKHLLNSIIIEFSALFNSLPAISSAFSYEKETRATFPPLPLSAQYR